MSKSREAAAEYNSMFTPFEKPKEVEGPIDPKNIALQWEYPGGLRITLEFFGRDDVYIFQESPLIGWFDCPATFEESAELAGDALLRHIEQLEGDDLRAWKSIESERRRDERRNNH